MSLRKLLTVGTCCFGLLVAHAIAQQQQPQREGTQPGADVSVEVETRTDQGKAQRTPQQTQERTQQATADPQRAEQLERQAKEKAEQAKQLAQQARQMAEEAKQLSRQAAEARGEEYREDSEWNLFGQDRRRERTARTRQQREPLKLDDVIGMTVNGRDGEELGTVDDVVLNPQTGEIRYAALSYGGWLGIGDKLFAVPWDALQANWHQDDEEYFLVMNKTKEALENAPGFDQDSWPHYADASFKQIEEFYADDDPARRERTRELRAFRQEEERQREEAKQPREGQVQQQTLIRVGDGDPLKGSDVVGMTVRNHENEDLGTINDGVIDEQSGRVRYAALSFGGWWGIGGKLFAVPWQAMTMRQDDDDLYLVLNKSKQELENAPGFDDDNWPQTANKSFQQEVDTFYGTRRREGTPQTETQERRQE